MFKHEEGNVAIDSPGDDDEVKDGEVGDGNVVANDGIIGHSGDGVSSGVKGNGVSGGVNDNGYVSDNYCGDNDGEKDCWRWWRH